MEKVMMIIPLEEEADVMLGVQVTVTGLKSEEE
jgi:hypothetical protein